MNTRQVKYEGELNLTDNMKIPCYVLDDGARILSGGQMQEALKLFPEKTVTKSGSRLARLLSYKALNELISNRFKPGHFEPIICYKGKQKINGFEATVLVDLCDVMLEARKKGLLETERQQIIAKQCEILIRSFAKVGIIALIDEATGYQYEREKFELQAILKLFISDEILEWQKTFHLGFYKEIFRLWNVPFTPESIKRKPPFIGMLTNELIYKNLPKGSFVLNKLKEKTPRNDSGNYKVRLHQSLTTYGKEELKKVLYSVETLASLSETKAKFKRLVQDRYGQRSLEFPNWDEIEEVKPPEKSMQFNTFDTQLKGLLNTPPPNKNIT